MAMVHDVRDGSARLRDSSFWTTYAHDLRDYFAFLATRSLAWDSVTLEDVGRFVSWLRLADEARDGAPAFWIKAEYVLKALRSLLVATITASPDRLIVQLLD